MNDFENFGDKASGGCDACGKSPARLEPRFVYAACEVCYKIAPVDFFRKIRDNNMPEQLGFESISDSFAELEAGKVDYRKLLIRCLESWYEAEGVMWYPEPKWNKEDRGITEAEINAVKEIELKINPSLIDYV